MVPTYYRFSCAVSDIDASCSHLTIKREKRRRPTELIPLIGTLKAFHEHVPRVISELYGAKAAG